MRTAGVRWGMREGDRVNYGAVEPRLYYAVAGAWHRLGGAFGVAGGSLFYWTRFLNVLLATVTVVVAGAAARLAVPESPALAVGVALFVAVVPRGGFYGGSNDALVPLTGCPAFCARVRPRARAGPPRG